MKTLATLFALGLACFSTPALAGDVIAGKVWAGACAGCHGLNGVSTSVNYPNLAGQKAEYLVIAMKAMKGGQRTNRNSVLCTPFMNALTDTDMENIAAYFYSL